MKHTYKNKILTQEKLHHVVEQPLFITSSRGERVLKLQVTPANVYPVKSPQTTNYERKHKNLTLANNTEIKCIHKTNPDQKERSLFDSRVQWSPYWIAGFKARGPKIKRPIILNDFRVELKVCKDSMWVFFGNYFSCVICMAIENYILYYLHEFTLTMKDYNNVFTYLILCMYLEHTFAHFANKLAYFNAVSLDTVVHPEDTS